MITNKYRWLFLILLIAVISIAIVFLVFDRRLKKIESSTNHERTTGEISHPQPTIQNETVFTNKNARPQ
jgi:uncharacterized protein YpmS